jgi:hypothetical protein
MNLISPNNQTEEDEKNIQLFNFHACGMELRAGANLGRCGYYHSFIFYRGRPGTGNHCTYGHGNPAILHPVTVIGTTVTKAAK